MTNFSKKYRKFLTLRSNVLFFVVGVLFVAFGLIAVLAPKGELIETEATIERIEVVPRSGENDHDVYVSYTDNEGVEHKNILLGGYASSMKVGGTVTISYDVENPENVSYGGELLPVIFLVIGLAAAVGSVLSAKKALADKGSEFDRVDMTRADAQTIEELENSTEEQKEYYFHFTGKLNQSYVLETPYRRAVYRADQEKLNPFGKEKFHFINETTGSERVREVSHTLTKEIGNGTISILVSSTFTVDGEDIWTLIGSMGYSLDPQRSGLHYDYDVYRYGVKVARLDAAGTNILKDGADSKLAEKITGSGLFKVYCRQADIEGVFLACFCLSRVEIDS